MQRLSVIVTIAIIFASCALADEGPPPPVTSATLPGVWEGIPDGSSSIVFQFVLEPSGNGWFVFIRGDTEEIYRLDSTEVARGKVILRFENTHPRKPVDLRYSRYITVRGTGRANSFFGIIVGSVEGGPKPGGDWINARISFCRPPWLHDAASTSKRTRRLLDKTRHSGPKKPNQAMQRTAGRSAFTVSMTPTFNPRPHAPSPAVADLGSR